MRAGIGGLAAMVMTGDASWERFSAGAMTGAMIGAGIGLTIETAGAGTGVMLAAAAGSGGLIGAGTGAASMGNVYTQGERVNWDGVLVGGAVGGLAGAASGLAGAGAGAGLGALGNALVGNAVQKSALSLALSSAFVHSVGGGLAGNFVSQSLNVGLGLQQGGYNWGQMGLAGLGGAVGGAVSFGLSRGLMRVDAQTGQLAIKCEVASSLWSKALFLGAHGAGGMLGDAIDQYAGALESGRPARWDWSRALHAGGLGLATGLAGGAAALRSFHQACFAAGTPLLVPGGSRAIEHIRPGEVVLSRNEADPQGAVEPKVVEEVFRRTGRVWLLRLQGGAEIRTTGEHPFFPARTMDWAPARELVPGDVLLGRVGELVLVEGVEDTGEYQTVYNLRVADVHTYFVGTCLAG